jgi:hypothetical protein
MRDDSNGAVAVSCRRNTIGLDLPEHDELLDLLQDFFAGPAGDEHPRAAADRNRKAGRARGLTAAKPLAIGSAVGARGAQKSCGFLAVEFETSLPALAADHQASERRGLGNAQEADDLVIEDAGMKMQIGVELMLPVAGDVGRQHDRLVALDGARDHGCVGRHGDEDLAKCPCLLRTAVGRHQPSAR